MLIPPYSKNTGQNIQYNKHFVKYNDTQITANLSYIGGGIKLNIYFLYRRRYDQIS